MGFFIKNKNAMLDYLQYLDTSDQLALAGSGVQTLQKPIANTNGAGFNWSFLGNVADALPQVIGQFNGKFQNNQLAIAEANARAAEAQAQAATAQPRNNTIVWVVAIISVLIIAYLLMRKK